MKQRVPVRERATLSATDLSVLFGISESAVAKRIQRSEFPEALQVDGRKRLWSYAQIEDMLDVATRSLAPPHLGMVPGGHEIEYLGLDIATDDVSFNFLVDGVLILSYQHPRSTFFDSDVRYSANYPSDGPASLPSDHLWGQWVYEPGKAQTMYAGRWAVDLGSGWNLLMGDDPGQKSAPQYLLSSRDIELRRRVFREIGMRESDMRIDLEGLLGFCLPVWPLDGFDLSEALRWKPGIDSFSRDLWSQATVLARAGSAIGRLSSFSESDHISFEDAVCWSDYIRLLEEFPDNLMVRDSKVGLRLESFTAEHKRITSGPQVDSETVPFEELLSDFFPDAELTFLAHADMGGCPGLGLAAVSEGEDVSYLTETRGALMMSVLLGWPRHYIRWLRSADNRLLALTPDGNQWWTSPLDWTRISTAADQHEKEY